MLPFLGKESLKMSLRKGSQSGEIIPEYLDWLNMVKRVFIIGRMGIKMSRTQYDSGRDWNDVATRQES